MTFLDWANVSFGLLSALWGFLLALKRLSPKPLLGVSLRRAQGNKQVWYNASAAMGRDMIALGGVAVLAGLTRLSVLRFLVIVGAAFINVRTNRHVERFLREKGGAA